MTQPQLTVSELIAKLAGLPPDAPAEVYLAEQLAEVFDVTWDEDTESVVIHAE